MINRKLWEHFLDKQKKTELFIKSNFLDGK